MFRRKRRRIKRIGESGQYLSCNFTNARILFGVLLGYALAALVISPEKIFLQAIKFREGESFTSSLTPSTQRHLASNFIIDRAPSVLSCNECCQSLKNYYKVVARNLKFVHIGPRNALSNRCSLVTALDFMKLFLIRTGGTREAQSRAGNFKTNLL